MTSVANTGNVFSQYYIPFNNIYYANKSTETFNVNSDSYVDVLFQSVSTK